MNFISTSLASWQSMVRMFEEAAEKCYSWLTWLFSVIAQAIIGAGKSLLASIMRIEVALLKEMLEICYNLFTWLFGIIFTVKITDNGKAFFAKNSSVVMAIVVIKIVSSLTLVLGKMSQMHTRNLYPLMVMLMFESAASLLSLSLISMSIVWVALNLWLCIFALFGYYCYSELYEMLPQRIKRWTMNHNPAAPSLPTVAEPNIAGE